MKKVTLFLSTILAASIMIAGIYAHQQQSIFNKKVRIAGRLLETGLGAVLGAYSIFHINPDSFKNIRLFVGAHLNTNGVNPYMNVHSDNHHLVGLGFACILLTDGAINLNKELNTK